VAVCSLLPHLFCDPNRARYITTQAKVNAHTPKRLVKELQAEVQRLRQLLKAREQTPHPETGGGLWLSDGDGLGWTMCSNTPVHGCVLGWADLNQTSVSRLSMSGLLDDDNSSVDSDGPVDVDRDLVEVRSAVVQDLTLVCMVDACSYCSCIDQHGGCVLLLFVLVLL